MRDPERSKFFYYVSSGAMQFIIQLWTLMEVATPFRCLFDQRFECLKIIHAAFL
ncbi:hypothetical protein X741_26915 [Mesorhizobium sp. LNHC229A00]|nr:hypothetical protein X741_26915 [Mesorhizobium sp. LNHC229A00]